MKPLVLIPGFMLDEQIWCRMEPQLGAVRTVVHPRIYGGETIADMARKILEVAPPVFSLTGFSMGGFIAREMCRLAPDRVDKLVLVATSARGDSESRKAVKAAALGTVAGFRGVSRSSIRRSLSAAFQQDGPLIEMIRDMSIRLGADVFAQQLAMPRDGDLDRLQDIQCATLVVAGASDALRRIEEAHELVAGIPGARLRVLPTGHMIPLEMPDQLFAEIHEFLTCERAHGPRPV